MAMWCIVAAGGKLARVTAIATLVLLNACGFMPAAPGPMFSGQDFAGWELVAPPASRLDAVLTRQAEGVIAVSGGPAGFFATTTSHENYRLHAEWRWSGKPGNAGVLLNIGADPLTGTWPRSLQVQTKAGYAGDMLPMAGASFAEPLSTAVGAPVAIKAHTGVDSEKPAGEWNACDIANQDGRIEVSINGRLQNIVTNAAPRAGRIGFQLEGAPYELRNVTLLPL
jgi:hypothetical protein